MEATNKTHKVCTTCKTMKPLLDFPPDKRQKDGKQAKCRPCINNWIKQHYRDNPAEHMLRRARARAKKHGLDFSITLDDITPLPMVCPVFGEPLRIAAEPQDPWSYSLDRVDNKMGYVPGNVVVMSHRANRLKNDGTADELEAIANWIRKQAASSPGSEAAITRAAERITIVN